LERRREAEEMAACGRGAVGKEVYRQEAFGREEKIRLFPADECQPP
jgi:hypothetical protein